jgi:hypothetical protein
MSSMDESGSESSLNMGRACFVAMPILPIYTSIHSATTLGQKLRYLVNLVQSLTE